MATEEKILQAVRLELGDLPEPFRDTFRGTDDKSEFDLSARNILASSVSVYTLDPETATETTVPSTDYTLDASNGMIRFDVRPTKDHLVVIEGTSYGIFSDDELVGTFLHGALSQHLKNRNVERVYRDSHGFIKYDREQMRVEDLPDEEEILVTLLTTIEALWALSTDASLDIDVQTAEGTSLPRGQRYRQIAAQIDLLTNKYQELSLLMGVGLYAPEVMTMRRVSRQTGRLVPIFQAREYDETGPPIRKRPPAHTRDTDPDGPASPFYSGTQGF